MHVKRRSDNDFMDRLIKIYIKFYALYRKILSLARRARNAIPVAPLNICSFIR